MRVTGFAGRDPCPSSTPFTVALRKPPRTWPGSFPGILTSSPASASSIGLAPTVPKANLPGCSEPSSTSSSTTPGVRQRLDEPPAVVYCRHFKNAQQGDQVIQKALLGILVIGAALFAPVGRPFDTWKSYGGG